jgi:hypothetical protein
MAKFYHISFNFEGRPASTKAVKEVLSKATDWATYAPNCWIIYSTQEKAETWYTRLRRVLNEDDSIFVCELNIENRQGWLPESIWTWIDKNRAQKK